MSKADGLVVLGCVVFLLLGVLGWLPMLSFGEGSVVFGGIAMVGE